MCLEIISMLANVQVLSANDSVFSLSEFIYRIINFTQAFNQNQCVRAICILRYLHLKYFPIVYLIIYQNQKLLYDQLVENGKNTFILKEY